MVASPRWRASSFRAARLSIGKVADPGGKPISTGAPATTGLGGGGGGGGVGAGGVGAVKPTTPGSFGGDGGASGTDGRVSSGAAGRPSPTGSSTEPRTGVLAGAGVGGASSATCTLDVGALRGGVTGVLGNGGCGGPSGPTWAGGGALAACRLADESSSLTGRGAGGNGRWTGAAGASGAMVEAYWALARSATRPLEILARAASSGGGGWSGIGPRLGYGASSFGGAGRSSATLPPSRPWNQSTGLILGADEQADSPSRARPNATEGTSRCAGGVLHSALIVCERMGATMVATPVSRNPRRMSEGESGPAAEQS